MNEGDAEISINSHFYYFGSRSGEEIVTLSNNAEWAICRSLHHDKSFLEWFSPHEYGVSIASVVENFMKSKLNFKNDNAKKNDSNTQEFIVTLSISNASHWSH